MESRHVRPMLTVQAAVTNEATETTGSDLGMAKPYPVTKKEADASSLHGGASLPCADQWPMVMVLRGGSRPQGTRDVFSRRRLLPNSELSRNMIQLIWRS
jgi:hypothetical protein